MDQLTPVGDRHPSRPVDARRNAAMLAAYDAQMRGQLSGRLPAGAHEELEGPIYRSWGWSPRGFVQHRDLSQLDASELDALIQHQVQIFTELKLAFEWKTYSHDRDAGLTDRLLAAGFVPEERENLVIGLVSELDQEPRLPAGISFRRVHSRQDTERMAEMLSAVWGEDLSFFGEFLFREADANPQDVVLLVAEADGQVVSTARANLFPGSEFASLWAGSTRAEWRGRGIYRASVAYRARLAAERGFTYLQVDASDASQPILERLGFITVSSTTPYVWSPQST
ncbi:MAG: GNAT family N-acetyltransferase [Candidatus Dormiibacterota bacterium]